MMKKEETLELQYRVELTRVHKKRVAPPGKIFLVSHIKQQSKEGPITYTKAFPILLGTPEDRVNEMAQTMMDQIKKQFSL